MNPQGRKRIPIPTREDTVKLYAELRNIQTCADRYNVCYETFRRWLKHYGITIQAPGKNNVLPCDKKGLTFRRKRK